MIRHNLYAEKTDNSLHPYLHIYNNKISVALCGCPKDAVVSVLVEETKEATDDLYFAYKDIKKGTLDFIFPSKVQVQLCSPDFFSYDIKEGNGEIVRVRITETVK